jgi:beta-galactosidase
LTAIDWHPHKGHQFGRHKEHQYNDTVRAYYDALYRLNIEVDILAVDDPRLSRYQLLIAPLLYAVSESSLQRLNQFTQEGGHILYAFRSGFANEHLKVRHVRQPAVIREAVGANYQLFVEPHEVTLQSDQLNIPSGQAIVSDWMELLEADASAEVWASYRHPYWNKYAAIVHNQYGAGTTTYVGCSISSEAVEAVLLRLIEKTTLDVATISLDYPVTVRHTVNRSGNTVLFFLNYSSQPQTMTLTFNADELLSGQHYLQGQSLNLADWGVAIFEVEKQ